MVLRMLMRFIANNEQLIQRMADSYPMRRAAQLVVSLIYKAKSVTNDHQLQNMTPERFKQFMEVFRNNIKKEIDGVKNEIKNRKL